MVFSSNTGNGSLRDKSSIQTGFGKSEYTYPLEKILIIANGSVYDLHNLIDLLWGFPELFFLLILCPDKEVVWPNLDHYAWGQGG
jgi:hypothetical protein